MGKYKIKYETNGIINEANIEFSTESAIKDILINHHKVDNPIILKIQEEISNVGNEALELAPNLQKSTDIYAVITFATALLGFMFLPLLFVPICFIFSLVSYYRLKDNKNLQGKGLRLMGALINAVNIIYLMYTFQIGIFKPNN